MDTALTNWEDITSTIAENTRTPARFELAIQEMYRKYVGAEAREIQFEYFRSLQKPLKSSILDHSSRMLTLTRYGNRLPGTEPILTEEQIKKCIFTSFPLAWQQQFIRSGQRVALRALSDIIEFMSNKKIFADSHHAVKNLDNKKNTFSNKEADGEHHKKRKGNGKPQYHVKRVKSTNHASLGPESECPIHGGHAWIKCFDNPNGTNFKPRGSDGLRTSLPSGRGRGRGSYTSPGQGHNGRGNGVGRDSGFLSFHASKPSIANAPVAATEVREQHHFDQLTEDPEWGWDTEGNPSGD
jgi:hypothetical protein